MNNEEFNQFCSGLKATSHVVQWGESDVWKVGEKMFAVGGWQKTEKPAYTFKCSEHNYEVLKDQPGFRPAPYLASRGMKWIQITDPSACPRDQLEYYLSESHRIVSLGLTKKKQKELGLNQE